MALKTETRDKLKTISTATVATALGILNFVMALAVGAGTGYVVGQTAIQGKIRNVAAVGAIALVASLNCG